MTTNQQELPWGGSGNENGFLTWRAQREQAQRELARKMGLPIGGAVEIWLSNGIRLRGKLELAESPLWVPEEQDPKLGLRVDGTSFTADEIESCIRAEDN
jgi:hypothetical protein